MIRTALLTTALVIGVASVAQAAFVLQVDVDGADDGPFTLNPNFAFGGDTSTAASSVRSFAPLLPEGDSIFGGDGTSEPDTYVYGYDPASDADNLATGGQYLGVDLDDNPVVGSGQTGGAAGLYRVYAAWPDTDNVGGDVTYEVVSGADSFSVLVDQNTANDPREGFDDVWVLLGLVEYDGQNEILVTQTASLNSFVSMRSAAIMFEPIPEPTAAVLFLLGAATLSVLRHRRRREF